MPTRRGRASPRLFPIGKDVKGAAGFLLAALPALGALLTALAITGDTIGQMARNHPVATTGAFGFAAVAVFLGALAAFAFSWIRFPLRDTIFLVIVALMIIPIQMALVPDLTLFSNPCGLWGGECKEVGRELRLTQSYVGIWLAHTAFALPFAIFLLRNFFITLPRDLIEAARVDGASNIGIFLRVILPLSVPALASFGIFQFLWVWNDLLNALIFIQNSDLLPLTVRISQLQGTYGTEWHLLSASAFVLMFVPLLVFFALQRYFVQGLLAGSVK